MNNFSDDILRNALLDAAWLDFSAAYDKDRTDAAPSRRFQESMRRMLADPLKWSRGIRHTVSKRILQSVACLVLTAAVTFGGVMAFSPTARAAVRDWFSTWFKDHIEYHFTDEKKDAAAIAPSWLPDGYAEIKHDESPNIILIIYENPDGQRITFTAFIMDGGNTSWMNKIDGEVRNATVLAFPAQLFISDSPQQSNTIRWFDEGNNCSYIVDGYLSESELIRIAESAYQ